MQRGYNQRNTTLNYYYKNLYICQNKHKQNTDLLERSGFILMCIHFQCNSKGCDVTIEANGSSGPLV